MRRMASIPLQRTGLAGSNWRKSPMTYWARWARSTLLCLLLLGNSGCGEAPVSDPAASDGASLQIGAYLGAGDFKFPPLRGDEDLVGGPLTVDDVLDLRPAGTSPFWNPATQRIAFSRAGQLWSMDREGGSQRLLGTELGDSGFFLTPQSPSYSPNGQWLAWISSESGSPEIWLWSEAERRQIQLTDLGADEIGAYSWSPDGSWIAFSANPRGNFDIWKVSVPGGETFRLTADRLYEVYPSWTPEGDLVYVRLDDRWVDHDLMWMSSEGGAARLIASDSDFFDYGYGRTFGYPLISPRSGEVAFPSHRSGWINYWRVPLAGGDPVAIAPEDADQANGAWSPDGQFFTYTEIRNGTQVLLVVSADGGEPRLLASPEVGVVSAPRWSPDGTELVYTLETPTRPAEIYRVPAGGGESTLLTARSVDDEAFQHLSLPEKIFYPSTDGLNVPAYLYRPRDASAEAPVPAMVWVHGGPTSQWNDAFQAQVQFFVQEGYAVLMPNIRGSSGYGKAFEDLNNGCWGHCDLEDLVAGVQYLKDLPYVDAGRIGIYGSSYGGIMSMAAAAFAPDVFQVAIPHGGYGDWVDFRLGHNELRHIKLLEYELGAFEEHEEVWRRSSSIYAVPGIRTPMLLVHGEGRYPVYRQTWEFARALQRHQKTFRYNTYAGENYYVSSRANVRQLWLDMLAFLDQHLKRAAQDLTSAEDVR